MAKLVRPLTDTEIRNSKAQKSMLYTMVITSLYPLDLREKVWLFTYKRPFTKERTKITIGQYPTITLAQAKGRRETLTRYFRKILTLSNTEMSSAKGN